MLTLSAQTRPPQVDRKNPHSHQRQPETPIANLLQRQEIPPARPPTKTDSSYSETTIAQGCRQSDAEAEEEIDSLPLEEIRCQGRVDVLLCSGFSVEAEARIDVWACLQMSDTTRWGARA